MPFFFGMIDMLINKFPGYPFYGYINGDILVENTIKDVLEQVYADILSGKLGPKVSLFTHRKNMFASFPDDLYNNNSESREYFPSFSLSLTSSELFTRFNRRSVTYWDVAIVRSSASLSPSIPFEISRAGPFSGQTRAHPAMPLKRITTPTR